MSTCLRARARAYVCVLAVICEGLRSSQSFFIPQLSVTPQDYSLTHSHAMLTFPDIPPPMHYYFGYYRMPYAFCINLQCFGNDTEVTQWVSCADVTTQAVKRGRCIECFLVCVLMPIC